MWKGRKKEKGRRKKEEGEKERGTEKGVGIKNNQRIRI